MTPLTDRRYVVLGAGPAGIGAAYELVQRGAQHVTVVDRNDCVGGLARTFDFRGYRFDVGPHRFMTKYDEIERLWIDTMGDDLLQRRRHTRIHFRGKFYPYPLRPLPTLMNLGMKEAVRTGLSFLKAKWDWRGQEPQNFAEWTTKAFGDRMAQAFFRTYLKKVWGIEAKEVGTDWAGQRIKQMHLWDFFTKKVREFLWQEKTERIGDMFYYPKRGAGTFYESLKQNLEAQGVRFLLQQEIDGIVRDGDRIQEVVLRGSEGHTVVPGDTFISSIPSNSFIAMMSPSAPAAVLDQLGVMRFRAHIAVNMVVGRANVFPDSWLYVQSPDVLIARIGNYNAFSPFLVPDPATSAIGAEYYCFAGDALWQKDDGEMIALAVRELASLGFIREDEFRDGFVVRHADAYPTYYLGYREGFARLRAYLEQFANLRLIGRGGMYKYKDQDHAMYTGMLTVRSLFVETDDVWTLGEEQEHFEERRRKPSGR
jgi:protoporphyrinogen oxidase